MELIVDEDNKVLYSASNNLDKGVQQQSNAFIALNSASGSQLWAFKYPSDSFKKFDVK